MILDLRTIFVLLVMNTLLMAFILYAGTGFHAGSRRERDATIVRWNLGLVLIAIAWTLIAARPAIPRVIGFVVADAAMLAGLLFQISALLHFCGRELPGWALAATVAAFSALQVPLQQDFAAFTLVVSLVFGSAQLALAVLSVMLGRHGAGGERWFMSAFYVAGTACVVARAANIVLAPDTRVDVFTSTPLDTATFLVLFAMTTTGTFGLLLALRGRAEAATERLAMHDPLTNVLNRRAFMELAEREMSRSRRGQSSVAVLMMDLDHFKKVNDSYGHATGDRVLADFAKVAAASLRREDILARYGGEEFCCLLPKLGLDEAIATAERIRQQVMSRPLGDLPTAVTVSIGASAGSGAEAIDILLERSDRALYEAKRCGRNRVIGLPAPALAPAGDLNSKPAAG